MRNLPKNQQSYLREQRLAKKHTAVEFYKTYWGEDYEKEYWATFERLVLSDFRDERFLSEMSEIK